MLRLPKSIKKYIRKEKARIRREVLDLKEQEKKIQNLYENIFKKFKKIAINKKKFNSKKNSENYESK